MRGPASWYCVTSQVVKHVKHLTIIFLLSRSISRRLCGVTDIRWLSSSKEGGHSSGRWPKSRVTAARVSVACVCRCVSLVSRMCVCAVTHTHIRHISHRFLHNAGRITSAMALAHASMCLSCFRHHIVKVYDLALSTQHNCNLYYASLSRSSDQRLADWAQSTPTRGRSLLRGSDPGISPHVSHHHMHHHMSSWLRRTHFPTWQACTRRKE